MFRLLLIYLTSVPFSASSATVLSQKKTEPIDFQQKCWSLLRLASSTPLNPKARDRGKSMILLPGFSSFSLMF
jgi:hypothetical protein